MVKMAMPQPARTAPVAVLAFEGPPGGRGAGRALGHHWPYDDIFAIQYFKQNLRAYWRRNGAEAADLLKVAAQDQARCKKRCAAFDTELMADLTKAGGGKICPNLRARLPPDVGRLQARRRLQRPAL